MRTPAKTVRRTAALAQAGARARRVLEGFILEQPETLRVLQLLGDPDAELDERLQMLQALRESRDALQWRVTQTKAQLIVMRSVGETAAGQSPTAARPVLSATATPTPLL